VEIIVFLPFCHQYSLNGKDIKAFLKAEQLKQILSTKGVFANRPRERPKNPGVTGKMLPPSKILFATQTVQFVGNQSNDSYYSNNC
jgi:hypothetical protein